LLRDKPGTTIINTETGGYGGFPQNEVDRRFAAATVDPEHCKFEKMASGAYQYDLLLEWVRFAADAGAFSRAFVGKLAALGRIPIGDADRFYFEPGEDSLSALCAAEKDEMRLRQLIDAFFDRVAFLTVATLIGLLKRTVGEGETPGLPVCISAEGTTFYNAKLLRPKIDQYMKRHSEGEFGLRHVFMRVEDATIFGSAVASFAK
jgi:hexokinase